MSGFKTSAIYGGKSGQKATDNQKFWVSFSPADGEFKAGFTGIIDLSVLGCEGFIKGNGLAGGTITLEASDDMTNTYGTQAITTPAAFEAVGPFKYLHIAVTVGEAQLTIQ